MNDSDESLDAVLNDEAPEAPVETAPAVEAEATPEADSPKGEDQVADSPPETAPKATEEQEWSRSVALDERRKRQKIEAELETAQALLAEKETPEVPRPDIFEDQKGALDHVEKSFEERLIDKTVRTSRKQMIRHVKDYGDMEAVFVKLAESDPRLIQEMRADDDPAGFAYDMAVKHVKLEALQTQDPDKLRARIKEEVRQELLQESQAKKAGEDELDSVTKTPSLARSRSAGSVDDVGEESLTDILG